MQDLVNDLKQKGWQVTEVSREDVKLVPVSSKGAVHCVDGRLGDKTEEVMKGPKIQGGVLGVMAIGLKRGDEAAVTEAIEKIKQAGYVASSHGDDHNDELGCGFGKLWSKGELTGLPKLEVDLPKVKQMVEEAQGEYVKLTGAHEEKVVRVNLVEGMTLIPDESGFILDAWVAEKLGINVMDLLKNAVETVEKLNGPKVIEIIK